MTGSSWSGVSIPGCDQVRMVTPRVWRSLASRKPGAARLPCLRISCAVAGGGRGMGRSSLRQAHGQEAPTPHLEGMPPADQPKVGMRASCHCLTQCFVFLLLENKIFYVKSPDF